MSAHDILSCLEKPIGKALISSHMARKSYYTRMRLLAATRARETRGTRRSASKQGPARAIPRVVESGLDQPRIRASSRG